MYHILFLGMIGYYTRVLTVSPFSFCSFCSLAAIYSQKTITNPKYLSLTQIWTFCIWKCLHLETSDVCNLSEYFIPLARTAIKTCNLSNINYYKHIKLNQLFSQNECGVKNYYVLLFTSSIFFCDSRLPIKQITKFLVYQR